MLFHFRTSSRSGTLESVLCMRLCVRPSSLRSQRWLTPGIWNFVPWLGIFWMMPVFLDLKKNQNGRRAAIFQNWQNAYYLHNSHSWGILLYYRHIGNMGQGIHPWYPICSMTFPSSSTCRLKVKFRKIMKYLLWFKIHLLLQLVTWYIV